MSDAIERWLVQMRKGMMELLVLARVAKGPAHGYAIATALREDAGITISEGTLYPLLARLTKQGWVEPEWLTAGSGPARKSYRITAAGEAHLSDMLAKWEGLDRSVRRFGGMDEG